MHLIGYARDQGQPTDQLLKLARDIFWQSFWRWLFFSSRVAASAQTKKFHFLLRKPTLSGSLFCYKEPFLCFAASRLRRRIQECEIHPHLSRWPRQRRLHGPHLWRRALRRGSARQISDRKQEFGSRTLSRRAWVPRDDPSGAGAARTRPSRYLEIRYEDFVERPPEIVAKVSAFLGRDSVKSKTARAACKQSIGISARRQDADKLKEAQRIAGGLPLSLGYQTVYC